MRLAAGWERVRDPGARDAFVRTCLVRAYLSEARRLWRRREFSYAEPGEPVGPGRAARPGRAAGPGRVAGDDEAERSASRLAFAAALRKLPPRQRATLVCRFYQELSVEATAVVLGCSTGTVKSQTARGLATLRELLGDLAVNEVRPRAAGEVQR